MQTKEITRVTPQIAALYLGQSCTVKWLTKNDHIVELGNTYESTIEYAKLVLMEDNDIAITPHLRRLESLTEEECKEVYFVANRRVFDEAYTEILSEVSCLDHYWKGDIELYREVGKFLIGTPKVWLHLLSKGFDLFNLIDLGLAKDNTNSK